MCPHWARRIASGIRRRESAGREDPCGRDRAPQRTWARETAWIRNSHAEIAEAPRAQWWCV